MIARAALAGLAAVLSLATAPAAASPAASVAAPSAPDLAARPRAPHGGPTRCAACHDASGWTHVTFSHARTGFPLTGRHAAVGCQGCHPADDFNRPLARACATCHRDVHGGQLGARCERCHAPTAWRDATFGLDAHRRTAFPLDGRHALIPCEECHGNQRDRSFSRPAVACIGCHRADFQRTALVAGALDHQAAGFPTDCRGCHSAWSFSPGLFPAHAACFSISGGPHGGIACRDCHTSGVPPIVAGKALLCDSQPQPADCIRCHDPTRHPAVTGFAPSNLRCYECHRFATVAGLRSTVLRRAVKGRP